MCEVARLARQFDGGDVAAIVEYLVGIRRRAHNDLRQVLATPGRHQDFRVGNVKPWRALSSAVRSSDESLCAQSSFAIQIHGPSATYDQVPDIE